MKIEGGMVMSNYEDVEWFNKILWCIYFIEETEKAYLIEIPERAKYAGYVFWYPKTLVRRERHGYCFSYTNKSKFYLKKFMNERNGRNTLVDEVTLNSVELNKVYTDHYFLTNNRMD